MVVFTKEELLRLAAISALKLNPNEIEFIEKQLKTTLDYVEQLGQANIETEQEAFHNINVFRDDKAIQKDSTLILAQAPAVEENYIVVPKILD